MDWLFVIFKLLNPSDGSLCIRGIKDGESCEMVYSKKAELQFEFWSDELIGFGVDLNNLSFPIIRIHFDYKNSFQ